MLRGGKVELMWLLFPSCKWCNVKSKHNLFYMLACYCQCVGAVISACAVRKLTYSSSLSLENLVNGFINTVVMYFYQLEVHWLSKTCIIW